MNLAFPWWLSWFGRALPFAGRRASLQAIPAEARSVPTKNAHEFPRPLGERFPLAGAETASPEYCLGVVDGFGEAETAAFLHHWPHRRLFLGASVEAWLIGLTTGAPRLSADFQTTVSVTVTSGEAEISAGNTATRLAEGQSATFPPATPLRIVTREFADVLLLLTRDHLPS